MTTIRLDLVDNVSRRLDRIESRIGRLNRPVGNLAGGFGGLKAAASGFVAALAVREVIQFGQAIVDASNKFQTYENRLRLITNSQGELDATFRKLQQSAIATRSGVGGTIDLYSKLTLATKELGVSNDQVLSVTEKFQKALAISGADAGTAAGAIRQFGQAMASGTVRGDEFNSIVEALGPALSIMAEESGLNVGELRKLSQEGKLTAQAFFEMVENSTALNEAFAKTRPTIEQMTIALNDAFDEFLVELGKATGLTEAYTDTVSAFTKGLQNASRTLRGLGVDLEDIFEASDAKDYAKAVQLIDDKLYILRKNANIPFLGDDEQIKTLTAMRVQMTLLAMEAEKVAKNVKPVPKFMSDLDLAMAGLKPYEGIIKNALGTDSVYELADPIKKLEMDIDQLTYAMSNLRTAEMELNKAGKLTSQERLKYTKQIQGVNELIIVKEAQIAKIRQTNTEKALEASKKEMERLADIAKQVEDKAEAVRVSLLSETEAEELSYQQRLQALEAYYIKQGVLTNQGQKQIERLNKAHQKRLQKISQSRISEQVDLLKAGEMSKIDLTKLSNDEIAQFTKDGAMEVFKIAAGQNKKIFEAYKAYQIANGIISTTSAVLNVLGNPAIPFPLNVAAAGVIGAMGAAQVAMIASQQYTGRQFGGNISKNKPYLVGETGPELMVPAGSGTMVPNRGLNNSAGTVNVNFNINAVDASSIDQLLIQRKAMITGFIRDATENQGNRSFV